MVATGLAALDEEARKRGAAGFADLAGERRASLVGEVAASHPGFIELLVFQTYTNYYQHPHVAVALGLKSGPPYPGGYELELGDLGPLDAVRERGKMYRDV